MYFYFVFSDRTKDVFQNLCGGLSGDIFIMLISSVLTGALAAKLKTHAKLSTQLAFRAQILFDTDRLLQKAKGETEILDVTCTQLLRLLNRNITAYVVENGTLSEGKLFSGEKEDTEDFLIPEEQQIAKWVCENRQHAGASTHHFPQAKCLYLAIRSGDNVYGVIGIPLQKETLDTFEYSILLSVINECALAMENAKNALEKEKNAVMAKMNSCGQIFFGRFRMIFVRRFAPFPVMQICCLAIVTVWTKLPNIRFIAISMMILNG